MAHWKEVLSQLSPDAESRMTELRGRLYAQLGGVGPLKIITFRGYGTPERFFLRGRVIEEKVFLAGEKNERLWADLVKIYTYARSVKVPNACLAVRFQSTEQIINADEDGYFTASLRPARPLAGHRLWHQVEFHLLNPIPLTQSRYPIKTIGEVLVPIQTARFAVLNDIDDCILNGEPEQLLRMARSAFLRNVRTRPAFPGEAALARALYNGAAGLDLNPLFYLSSGRGELHDLLVQWQNLRGMPVGPIVFSRRNKLAELSRMLDLYPHLPFVLIGGPREDPEIFTALAARYPGRIPAMYIRDLGCDPKRAEDIRALAGKVRSAGSALLLAHDTLAIARHAASLGFLQPSRLKGISEEIQKDATPPGLVEELLEQPSTIKSTKVTRQAVKQEAGEKKAYTPEDVKKNK